MDNQCDCARRPPVALRKAINPTHLCEDEAWDSLHTLGSFWPHAAANYESRLVKCFKECVPTHLHEPFATQIARFYADLILRKLNGAQFDWVTRVLSSAETKPEDSRPLALLTDLLCSRTGACSLTHIFFKSESRPPMRVVKTMSGPGALRIRVNYVLQDLFVKPCRMGGSVLLLDDIGNTGATMRVYSHTLKAFAGVDRVTAVNLAATRFAGGKDKLGMLKLDTSALTDHPSIGPVWTDSEGRFHAGKDCSAARGRLVCEVRFAAERQMAKCGLCFTN